jgi:hypothetical protein
MIGVYRADSGIKITTNNQKFAPVVASGISEQLSAFDPTRPRLMRT